MSRRLSSGTGIYHIEVNGGEEKPQQEATFTFLDLKKQKLSHIMMKRRRRLARLPGVGLRQEVYLLKTLLLWKGETVRNLGHWTTETQMRMTRPEIIGLLK